MMRSWRIVVFGGTLALTALLSAQEPMPQNAVIGEVTYRERIALPPDAIVRVRLEAAAEPERPPRRLAEVTVPTGGKQVPIPFTLTYEAAKILPNKRYEVRATISSGDQVLFASRGRYPVITKGAPSKVQILVEPAGTGARRPRPPTPAGPDLAGSSWKLTSIGDTPAAAAGELAFAAEKDQIAGSTGCNHFFGTYSAGEGPSLKLAPAGMTLMACSGDTAAQETSFLDALRATASYRISGKTLELLDGGGHVLARFASGGGASPTPPAH